MTGPEAQEVQIVDVRDLPSPDPQRRGKVDRFVVYQVKDRPRLAVRLPAETATEAAVIAAIREDLQGRAALVGRTLKL